jgi:hypothetical protein
MFVATVAPSSDGCADIICSSLLESTVAMGALTSAHSLLLDRTHNLHLVCKRRQSEIKYSLHLITYIKFIQRVHPSNNIYTYTNQFIHQVQQNLNIHIKFNKS